MERAAGRIPVIAGTGTNNTEHVLRNTREACRVGADAVLVVTPYYNKATQNGLIKHFYTVADASTVPVIVYNVPGRTGVNIQPKTLAALAEHPNIAGVKEATVTIAGKEIKLAVANGTGNARILMDKMKAGEADYTFIEIMGCPGGCETGGGQPIVPARERMVVDPKVVRAKAIYEEDLAMKERKSH